MTTRQLNLTLLLHVLHLGARSQQTSMNPQSRLGIIERIYSINTSSLLTISLKVVFPLYVFFFCGTLVF